MEYFIEYRQTNLDDWQTFESKPITNFVDACRTASKVLDEIFGFDLYYNERANKMIQIVEWKDGKAKIY